MNDDEMTRRAAVAAEGAEGAEEEATLDGNAAAGAPRAASVAR